MISATIPSKRKRIPKQFFEAPAAAVAPPAAAPPAAKKGGRMKTMAAGPRGAPQSKVKTKAVSRIGLAPPPSSKATAPPPSVPSDATPAPPPPTMDVDKASKARSHNVIPSNVLAVDTLWTGVPGNYTDPKAPAALAAVRKFVDEGRFVDATAASGLYGGPTEDFLKNTAYPLLEGCALFLVDWLTEEPRGLLETNPSTSPEHDFIAPGAGGQQASVSYSTTMDISIIREIFMAVVSSAEVLGKSDTALVQEIKKVLPRLPPITIAKDKTIMEWVNAQVFLWFGFVLS
ncbi:hypothetical protein ACQ4PT_038597 [Festuca glaucescens]